ncbi:hypothetical protein [Halobacterium zhouii]|uniref:hypothetical protein n=1 Tax=Halobacterium zhouii TaxID=2902624 RepID=UPI001E41BEA1|nr:hypothetical protein [Halobacterium zhouii]
MSDETVVETDGVTVSKFFNAEDFPVPAVAFEVSSSLDDSAEFAIVDEIPDEFGIDQIGFHPEYGSEHWTADGDGVVRFEREIDAGESFTTVYGVRMEADQDETPFLSAPTVEVAGEDIDDVVPPESTSVVRELAGGERDTVPGLEDDEEIEADLDADESVEALEGDDAEILGSAEEKLGVADDAPTEDDADDETANADATAEPGLSAEDVDGIGAGGTTDDEDSVTVDDTEPVSDSDPIDAGLDDDASLDVDTSAGSDTDASAGASTGEVPDSFDASDIVGALADAVREDRVSDEDLATLQEAFGGVPKSTQTEIEHLQSRVSEMESYTDALKAFIDENGTAQDVLADFESDLETLESDVAAVQDDVSSVEGDVADVETEVADADAERADLRQQVEDLESDLEAVSALREDVERLAGDLDALDERVAGAEDLSMDVEELESDVEAIEDDVEAMEEWRDQLSDVFGA